MYFGIAGIETNPLIPLLVGYFCALFLSWIGLTGAFLTLPFMISFYNYVSPSVSATNLVVNLIAPLGGIYAYLKEKRMAWTIGILAGLGAVVGSYAGAYIRINYFYSPEPFKALVGAVMLLLAIRLFYELTSRGKSKKEEQRKLMERFSCRTKEKEELFSSRLGKEAVYKTTRLSLREFKFNFWGEEFKANPIIIFLAGALIGIIGALIGVGGAFILVPFLTSIVGLPIYVVAGSTLLFTYMTSISGVAFYSLIKNTQPDWLLGLLFGVGAAFGGYTSAKLQKYVTEKALKIILGAILALWGISYIIKGIM